MKKKIRIATLQIRTEPGKTAENLKRAEHLLTEVSGKAEFVFLPELFAAGYAANRSIFSMAETEKGPTYKWMGSQAEKHGIYLGGGVPVLSRDHIYNRYCIYGPDGSSAGCAQKNYAEARCFKRDEGRFIINAGGYRIGVAICGDSHMTDVVRKLQDAEIDLAVLPHAWPVMEDEQGKTGEFASKTSELLGVPLVFVNGVGPMDKMDGITGKLIVPSKFALRGGSTIINRAGETVERLGASAGVLCSGVTPGRSAYNLPEVPDYYGWTHPGSLIIRKFIFPLDIIISKAVYNRNRKKLIPPQVQADSPDIHSL